MSPHFGRCPCPDNLIQIESGPTLENLVKEIRYAGFHAANPGPVLMQSAHNNTFDGTPLGGNIKPMVHGFDVPTAIGILPDIHPCGNSTEDEKCDSAISPAQPTVVENLKDESQGSSVVCYIVISLLFLALLIAIGCQLYKRFKR